VISEDIRKKLPNLTRWFQFIRSTGPFLAILGSSQLCGKNAFIVHDSAPEADTKKESA
jgi:hypothetical protein